MESRKVRQNESAKEEKKRKGIDFEIFERKQKTT
jgi:hypothetical protein